ncbi:response regulator [Oscillatoriales cyanobacterium LEGE 11467]|uniref:Response regulator n=1 Tax=Zarconia navalis LEGE 11467 TaxID=1828826 RepID=A0A928ZB58_9CYAN|nr:adenylate/guanylate cyclase domain-containing protein [Zarconia navalis]MBE9042326.1 response regulator [Zarconia navalis LEGE 11467]
MSKTAILCVDDEVTIVESLKIELESIFGEEYLIEIAQDSEEALEVIAELMEDNYEIALVISDCIMPGMKGDELLVRIHELSPKTIKIMLTGQAELEAVKTTINKAKLYRYISKPWQKDDLKLTIKEAINRYLKDKKFAKKNIELIQLNTELEDLNKKQTALIEKLCKKERELEQINQAYERFVPHQFIKKLDRDSIVEVNLGDQVQQEMSVLFSDIRNFTTLSEKMTPEDNFKFINAYLSRMEPSILEHQGFIDKYIGDAIMALFSGSADEAVKAGISMLKTLAQYNLSRDNDRRPKLSIGIGINTGSLILGTVGGKFRMDSTVISDAVSLASKLEGLTKQYCVSFLIARDTFVRLQNPFDYNIRFLDRVRIHEKSEWVAMFEVFDADPPEIREGKIKTKILFEKALCLRYEGKLREAAKLFVQCWKQNPGDRAAEIYAKLCYKNQPNLSAAH